MFALFLLFFLFIAGPSSGQPTEHSHSSLIRNNSLNFDLLVSAAVERSSERLLRASRQNQAGAYEAASNGLLPGQYTLQASMFDDGITGNQNIRETEIGVQIGLWRMGERQAAESLSTSYGKRAAVFDDYLRWISSGRVRQVLATLNKADNALAREREIAESLQEIISVVEMQLAEGEIAESELLRVQAESLEQQLRVIDAEAEVVDAERNYQIITGFSVRPLTKLLEPSLHVTSDIADLEVAVSHPLLQMLMQEVEIAKRGAKQLSFTARSRSTLSIGARREQAGVMTPNSDTLSVGFSVPIGGRRQVRPQVENALGDAANAEVAMHRAQRGLEQSLHEAAHQLVVVSEAMEINANQRSVAERRVAMTISAFEEAEVSLEELLRVRRGLATIGREADALEAEKIKLISEYLQAQGVVL